MIAYGSSFLEVTSTLEQLDRVVELNEMAKPKFDTLSYDVMLRVEILAKEHFDRLISDEPFSSDGEDLMDFIKEKSEFNALGVTDEEFVDIISEIREFIRNIAADELLAGWRKEIVKYGKFVGSGEYSVQMQSRGTNPNLWKASNQYFERED